MSNNRLITTETGVSVVMPVKNAGDYLTPAIDSILKQTHTKLELIVVNDHSTDHAIVRAQRSFVDKRLRFIDSPSTGIIAALNHGVSQAAYPVIARMDGDDIATKDRLELQLRYMADNPNVDIIGAQVGLFKDNEAIGQGYSLYEKWINGLCDHQSIAQQFFVESTIPHPTALFRKRTFYQLGEYQDHGWPEDYDLWCRAFIAGMRFGKPSDQILLHWRDHGERASRQDTRYQKSEFLACKAHYLAQYLKNTLNTHQCSIWGAGPTGLKLHDLLEANGIQVTGFFDVNPKIKNRQKRNKLIKVFDNIDELDAGELKRNVCLAAVGARGASGLLDQLFRRNGLVINQDYILTA